MGGSALSLGGCSGAGLPCVTCDQDDDAVAQARALPQPTLGAMYEEGEARVRSGGPRRRRNKPLVTPLPGVDTRSRFEFQAFGSDSVRVVLRHCFDHGLALWLEGMNTPEGRVVLYWGEGPTAGNQVLWRKPAPAAR